MNNRDYKKFAPGNIMHVYNRGNNKEKIFLDEQDHKAFLFRLALCLGYTEEELSSHKLITTPSSRIRILGTEKKHFKLHAFCLMPNHFHLLIEQAEDTSISKLISRLCTSYAKYMNKKYNRTGHTFQDKFKAVLVENNPQLMWNSSYIHMNPVKDGLVKHPLQYTWSSYIDFALERNLPFVTQDLILSTFEGKKNFIEQTLNFKPKFEYAKDGL